MSQVPDHPKWTAMMGSSILYSTLIIGFSAVVMNSRLIILTDVTNLETLEQAETDLRDFLRIAFFVAIGSSFLMHSQFGWMGVIINLAVAGLTVWLLTRLYLQSLNKVRAKLLKDKSSN